MINENPLLYQKGDKRTKKTQDQLTTTEEEAVVPRLAQRKVKCAHEKVAKNQTKHFIPTNYLTPECVRQVKPVVHQNPMQQGDNKKRYDP